MFMNFFYIAIALAALGFSIFIHELGHFMAARKRGLIADRFSIGFGPRLFGWHWKGTDFRLSLLPLGGYGSLPPLADMGRVEGGEKIPSTSLPPISYADKMIVAVMGAVFNILFAFAISLILWGVGRDIVKSTVVDVVQQAVVNSEGVVVPGPAYEAGILPGDAIVRVDGQKVGDWMQIQNAVMTGLGRNEQGQAFSQIELLREGALQSITVYPQLTSSEAIRSLGIQPGTELVVSMLQTGMPAMEAGLQVGDQLHALDGQLIESAAFLNIYLKNYGQRVINLHVLREGTEHILPIQPKIAAGEQSPRFGFAYNYALIKARVHLNPIEQLSIMANTMRMTLLALVNHQSDVKVRNMSGPVGIVHGLTTMARYSFVDLIWFTALINVNLAILNLLPIPVLDGGHMLFATLGKLMGRPVPKKIMELSYTGCITVLLSFMVYVTFFDVRRVGEDVGIIGDASPTQPKGPTELDSADTPQE
jgi:regulator of sigma E protease